MGYDRSLGCVRTGTRCWGLLSLLFERKEKREREQDKSMADKIAAFRANSIFCRAFPTMRLKYGSVRRGNVFYS